MTEATTRQFARLGVLRVSPAADEIRVQVDWWRAQSLRETVKTVLFAFAGLFVAATFSIWAVSSAAAGDFFTGWRLFVFVGLPMALLIAVGGWAFYVFLATVINQTETVFTPQRVTTRATPLPFPAPSVDMPIADVTQITFTEQYTPRMTVGCTVRAVGTDGTEALLFAFYDTPDIVERLARRVGDLYSSTGVDVVHAPLERE